MSEDIVAIVAFGIMLFMSILAGVAMVRAERRKDRGP